MFTRFNIMKRSPDHRPVRISRANWIAFFALTAMGLAVLLYGAASRNAPQLASGENATAISPVSLTGHTGGDRAVASKPSLSSPVRVGHRPIEALRVGDRVFASNPEISDGERATWAEPEWLQWLHLSLQMPLFDDGDSHEEPKILRIELLTSSSAADISVRWKCGA